MIMARNKSKSSEEIIVEITKEDEVKMDTTNKSIIKIDIE